MRSTFWLQWLKTSFKHRQSRRGKPVRRSKRVHLNLEALEERITLNATYTVTTTTDFAFTAVNDANGVITAGAGVGQVSLRSAIQAANDTPSASGTPNIINLPNGTYNLTTGAGDTGSDNSTAELGIAPDASNPVNLDTMIVGTSQSGTVINQTVANARVFDIDFNSNGNIQFSASNLTIEGGSDTMGGGGVLFGGGTGDQATFASVLFTNNSVPTSNTNAPGGAISDAGGDLIITNSTFDSNTVGTVGTTNLGSGSGAIDLFPAIDSTLTITGTTFINNQAAASESDQGGGAIRAETNGNNVTVNISGSNFINNEITSGDSTGGGAIYMPSGSLTVNDTNFSGNQITTSGAGVDGGGAIYFGGSSLTANFDRFVGNSTANAGAGNEIDFNADNGGTVNIEDDWWGSNSGPASGDNVQTNPTAALAPTHWLVLSNSANPTSIPDGGTSNLTADFIHDNTGADVSAMDPDATHSFPAFIGLAVTYGVPVDGTLSNEQTTIQSGGTATATYTGTTVGAGSSSVTVDGVTVTADVMVTGNPVPTLTSVSPSSATLGSPDTVVTLTGTGFINGSTAGFDGIPIATTFVSATELFAVIPAADLTTAGMDSITVVTGGPGGGTSGSQTFTVNPTPTVQFTMGSETVNESAGTFSIPVTLTGAPPTFSNSTFASGFNLPEFLAFDAAGNLYVADLGDGTVSKVTPAGVVTLFASGFNEPIGLAFDAAGNLYVANAGSGTVSEASSTGVVNPIPFASGFSEPTGLAFDAAGNLYVADAGAGTVSKVTPGGVVSPFASGFSEPAGLAFDAAGNLYVANFSSSGDAVSKVTPGGVVSPFASGFKQPDGLAFDAAGNLYVASGDAVSKVTPAGVVSTFATGFNQTDGLAFDAAGNLYVADNGDGAMSEVSTAVTVPFTLGGTAVSGVDYSGVSPSPLVFAPGQNTVDVTGTLMNDPGPAQTLTFTLGTPSSNAALGGVAANTLTIGEPPTLTSISPTSATADDNDTTITLTGTGFVNGSTADFNGAPITTTFVSATELTAVISAADLATAGSDPITVVTAGPGGGTSNSQTFTINPAPALTSINPTSATAGDNDTTITLTGMNFVSGFTTVFRGVALVTTFVSATELTAVIPASDLTTAGMDSITVVTPGGGASNSQAFTINQAPTLTSISPTSGTVGDTDTTITLTGTNFVSGFTADFNGTALATTFVSATELTAVIPATDLTTAGPEPITVVAPGGSVTAAQMFTVNPAPTLTSISPTSGTVGDNDTTITLTGTNFVNGFTADFNGTALATTFVSATQLTAVIPAADLTTAGPDAITVVAPGGSATAPQIFTVNPAPTLTKLNPTSATAGDSDTTITLTGTNFASGFTADFNGAALATTFVSATELTAVIPTADLTTAGPHSITVVAPGGSTTAAVAFTVNPAPTLTSVSPTSATAGDRDTTVTLTGTNFANGFTADFNGAALATTFVSATELTAVIPTADLTTAGPDSITVVAPGGSTTTAQTFTVNPAPTLTSISPTSATVGDNDTTIMLTGTNFVSGFTADFNGTALATTFVTATELTAVIPAVDLTTAGANSITVVAPGGSTTAAQPFTVNNPAPILTSISPTSATAGSPDTTITLTGTGFVSGSTADFNGAPLATTFINATQLTAVVPAADLATAGMDSITVVNAGPGGGTSDLLIFNVGSPPPSPAVELPPSVSVAFGPAGVVVELVNSAGFLTQVVNGVAQPMGNGGVRSASVAYLGDTQVLEVVGLNGVLTQFINGVGVQIGNGGVSSASVAYQGDTQVLEVVGLNGVLTQFINGVGVQIGNGGVSSASVAYLGDTQVLEVVGVNGILTQFINGVPQQLGEAGVQSASVAFNANNEVLDIIFSDGTLDQFTAFGVQPLGIIS